MYLEPVESGGRDGVIPDSQLVALHQHQLPLRHLLHVKVAGTVHNGPVLVPVLPGDGLASITQSSVLEVEIAERRESFQIIH